MRGETMTKLPKFLEEELRFIPKAKLSKIDEHIRDQDSAYNRGIIKAWELVKEKINNAKSKLKKHNHEVQMRNNESGRYQQGFAYGAANAKFYLEEELK
jgi:hypothetical protein